MTPALIIVRRVLEEAGFVEDGTTRQDTVRIPTQRSPVYGGIGGERRTFGGRARFVRPGSDVRVTVGPVTVNVYRRTMLGRIESLRHFRTKQIDAVSFRSFLGSVTRAARCSTNRDLEGIKGNMTENQWEVVQEPIKQGFEWWRLVRNTTSNRHWLESTTNDARQSDPDAPWDSCCAIDTDALDEPLAVLVQRYLSNTRPKPL